MKTVELEFEYDEKTESHVAKHKGKIVTLFSGSDEERPGKHWVNLMELGDVYVGEQTETPAGEAGPLSQEALQILERNEEPEPEAEPAAPVEEESKELVRLKQKEPENKLPRKVLSKEPNKRKVPRLKRADVEAIVEERVQERLRAAGPKLEAYIEKRVQQTVAKLQPNEEGVKQVDQDELVVRLVLQRLTAQRRWGGNRIIFDDICKGTLHGIPKSSARTALKILMSQKWVQQGPNDTYSLDPAHRGVIEERIGTPSATTSKAPAREEAAPAAVDVDLSDYPTRKEMHLTLQDLRKQIPDPKDFEKPQTPQLTIDFSPMQSQIDSIRNKLDAIRNVDDPKLIDKVNARIDELRIHLHEYQWTSAMRNAQQLIVEDLHPPNDVVDGFFDALQAVSALAPELPPYVAVLPDKECLNGPDCKYAVTDEARLVLGIRCDKKRIIFRMLESHHCKNDEWVVLRKQNMPNDVLATLKTELRKAGVGVRME